jgi:hypothetical protein
MVTLGTVAPPFELLDVITGHALGRDDVFASSRDAVSGVPADETEGGSGLKADGRAGLLVMFLCVHCPFVKHLEAALGALGRDYAGRIAMVAINSNDVRQYPEDGPEEMRAQAQRLGWNFPYLFDETQEVARSYDAACTPDFFLFDADLALVYRGQFDGSRPQRPSGGGNDLQVTGETLRQAMDDVIAGRRPDTDQRGSLGCNIKWKSAA